MFSLPHYWWLYKFGTVWGMDNWKLFIYCTLDFLLKKITSILTWWETGNIVHANVIYNSKGTAVSSAWENTVALTWDTCMFLPPKTTCILPLMDQGILQIVKNCYWKNLSFRKLVKSKILVLRKVFLHYKVAKHQRRNLHVHNSYFLFSRLLIIQNSCLSPEGNLGWAMFGFCWSMLCFKVTPNYSDIAPQTNKKTTVLGKVVCQS